jgi:hypothetical protein
MIPKIVHVCWLSGDPFPDKIAKCIDSMKEKLPDYELRIWSKDDFDVNSNIWVKQAFENKKYAFAADFFRFWVLYNYGGIYLDSDVEVFGNFDKFLDYESFIGFEYLNIPEAAVVGATKGCAWVKNCLDWYKDKTFITSEGEMRMEVVPLLVRLQLIKLFNCKLVDNGKVQTLPGLTIFPYKYFSPKNYFSEKAKIYRETVCVHRFASAWGPNIKRKWPRVIHLIVIFFLGKINHDRLFRVFRPLSPFYNGFEV